MRLTARDVRARPSGRGSDARTLEAIRKTYAIAAMSCSQSAKRIVRAATELLMERKGTRPAR